MNLSSMPVAPQWRWPMLLPSFGDPRCYRCRWTMPNYVRGYSTWGVREHRIELQGMPGDGVWYLAALCERCWDRSTVDERLLAYGWLLRHADTDTEESRAILASILASVLKASRIWP